MKKFAVLVILAFLLVSPLFVAGGNALGQASLYPERGNVFSEIYLQVRNFDPGHTGGMFQKPFFLYVFWDGKPIITGLGDGRAGYFDFHFYPPREHPYSNLGNHIIYVEVWFGLYFRSNYTLVFEIIEYYPPQDLFWTWWGNLTSEIREQLRGPRGYLGERGPRGAQGIKGDTGQRGLKGDKGAPGISYWDETVLGIGISIVSLVLSAAALALVYQKGFSKKNSRVRLSDEELLDRIELAKRGRKKK